MDIERIIDKTNHELREVLYQAENEYNEKEKDLRQNLEAILNVMLSDYVYNTPISEYQKCSKVVNDNSIQMEISLLVNEIFKDRGFRDQGMIKYIVSKIQRLITRDTNE